MNTHHKKTPEMYNKPSEETILAAAKIANGIKKPGQTKEQTKLIEQGIQKGIELYKKGQKAKAREADKAKKKQRKQTLASSKEQDVVVQAAPADHKLPWLLLGISWCLFAAVYIYTQAT